MTVVIYCHGVQTTAVLDRGIWRCSDCWKRLKIVPPETKRAAA